MQFWVDSTSGMGFARDTRDGSFVIQDPTRHQGRDVFHLGKMVLVSFVGIRSRLEPLSDSGDRAQALSAYDEWRAGAPAERARREAETLRERAQREADALREREELRVLALEREQRLRKRATQAAQEADSLKQLIALLHESGVTDRDGTPLLPLLPILLRIQAGEPLELEEVDWLSSERLFGIAARAHLNEYRRTRDLWQLVKACARFRDAGMPQEGLDVSVEAVSAPADARAKAALLTTRGGALRDLGDYDRAIEAAEAALRINKAEPAFAYALLGGIYFDLGQLTKADDYFAKAGGSKAKSDEAWKKELKRAPEHIRAAAVAFLLTKDPEGYAWAREYVVPRAG